VQHAPKLARGAVIDHRLLLRSGSAPSRPRRSLQTYPVVN
jgi:hypothetical protein